jgi:hypothetical protein
VAEWVRPLSRPTGASALWHAPRIKSFTTLTYCEENIEGPLEIASPDRAEREGRCVTCSTRLRPPPVAPTVTKALVKKAAAEKTVDRSTPKKKTNKVPVAKRSVRGSRRRRA